jgi:hypothetical protein
LPGTKQEQERGVTANGHRVSFETHESVLNLAWGCTAVIPVLRRLRQEDFKFEVSLGNIARL